VEIGINFNGDLSPRHIVKGSKISEGTGYDCIWIGEAAEYMHPFPIMALVSQETETIKVGTGIISPQLNRCYHIAKAFHTLQEVYGNRFVVGLAPGDYRGLEKTGAATSHSLKKVTSCVMKLRRSLSSNHWSSANASSKMAFEEAPSLEMLPIYVGASGPKMIETGSKVADGVLLNYVSPEFLKWALKFLRNAQCRKVAYGPALLEPDKKNLEHLRISAAIVLSGANRTLVEEFGLEDAASEVDKILREKQFYRLKEYDGILLEKFAIHGSLHELEQRVDEIKALGMHHIVLATPFCRNLESIEKVGQAFTK